MFSTLKTSPIFSPDRISWEKIFCFSGPGNLVLDPMCGSGTTCLVAAQNERRFVGIEINPDYCAVAREWLQVETGHRRNEVCAEMSLLVREKATLYSVAEPDEGIFL